MYNSVAHGGADRENRIKELKCSFAADSFCLSDFWATEAYLNVVMLAYNPMSRFRQAVLKANVMQSSGKDAPRTLKTRRYELFAAAGYITTAGRQDILKLGAAMRQRQWLEGLRDRSKTFSLPVRFTLAFFTAYVLMENLG
ncbi:MAG: transposase [Sulfuricaulis sp.]